ncbi:MAG: hypothetical protein DMG17_25075 [Acidobacteria bacterium]|nr:MAG: hypothetical protein DMG17_25075 [Acidobacteriota bacterium]
MEESRRSSPQGSSTCQAFPCLPIREQPLPEEEVDQIARDTDAYLEICSSGNSRLVLTRRRDTHGILRTEQRIALIKDVEVFAVAMNIFVNKFVTSSALKGARQ